MKRLYVVSFLLLFAFSATVAAVRGPSPEELTPRQPDPGESATSIEPRVAPSNPMTQEIQALVQVRQTEVVELNERALRSDARTQLQIQREIGEIKQQMYLDILAIQAEHARRAGRTERADRILAQIEEIQNPTNSARRVARDPHTHRLLEDQPGGGQ